MPRNVAKNPPGGKRVGNAEVERRARRIDELLRAGTPRSAIVADCAATFGMSARAVDDYMRRVRERWAADGAGAVDDERGATVQRLEALTRKLESKSAWSALVQAHRLLADVRGVRSAQRIDARIDAATNTPPNVTMADAVHQVCMAADALGRAFGQRGAAPPALEDAAELRRAAARLEALAHFAESGEHPSGGRTGARTAN
jgi:hypothetical protein